MTRKRSSQRTAASLRWRRSQLWPVSRHPRRSQVASRRLLALTELCVAIAIAALWSGYALAFNGGSRLIGPAPGVSRRTSPLRLANGGGHSCLVRADGSIRCWGDNSAGQIGDGTVTNRLTPVTVAGITTAVGVTGGALHTCAWLADGTARCWGLNNHGQIGDGTTVGRHTPVVVTGLSNVISMAAGDLHTCALLLDGTVRCWGNNFNGELGDGTTTDRHSPTQIFSLNGVAALSAGTAHTCAVLGDGGPVPIRLTVWGLV